MRFPWSNLLASLCLLLPTAAAAATAPTALDSLAAAERAFSATSVEKGMRDAFLAFLSEDGVIFRPLPLNGKKVWEERAPVSGTLIWEPSFAEISVAGDLGYTTGPWEFRTPGDPDVAHGHFISVWKRPPGGAWRVAADIGVSHGKPDRGVGSGAFESRASPKAAAVQHGTAADLASLDLGISRATRSKGIGAGYVSGSDPDLRFNTEGSMPRQGAAAAKAALDSMRGELRLGTIGSGLAASRDLGYTYGIAGRYATRNAPAPADSCVYLNVWRRDIAGRWRLAMAVLNPVRRR